MAMAMAIVENPRSPSPAVSTLTSSSTSQLTRMSDDQIDSPLDRTA